jgi:serine/threonine-protein kinase
MLNDQDDEAEPLLLEEIAAGRKLHDGPSMLVANATDLLAEVRNDQKRFAEAAALALEADAMYTTIFGPRHNYRAFALVHLGVAKLGLRDGPGALAAFGEALALRREAFGNEHKDTANALWNLGGAEVEFGDAAGGEKHLRESLAIRQRVLPPDHVAIPRTRLKLIPALIALKRSEEASDEVRKAQDEFARAPDTTPSDRKALAELAAALAAQPGNAGKVDTR